MSYVLPFDNSVCSETARNAIDNFASILINAFEQYQILWKENIDLQKKYQECKRAKDVSENIKKEELSQKLCTTCSRKLNNNTDTEQNFYTVEQNIKKEPLEAVSNASLNSFTNPISQDLLEGVVLNPYFNNEENVSNKLVTPTKAAKAVPSMESPIISKSRIKSEKYTPARRKVSRNLERSISYAISNSTPEKKNDEKIFTKDIRCKTEKNSPLRTLENKTSFIDSLKKFNDVNHTNATADSASTTKNSGKLTFGKLYNIKTFSREKNLKQTRLLFVPPKQSTDLTLLDDSSVIVENTICDETKPEKDIKKNDRLNSKEEKIFLVNKNEKMFCEDVVLPSPIHASRATNVNKFLRLKRKSPDSIMQSTDEKKHCSFKEKMFKKDDGEIVDESDIFANLDLSKFENKENFVSENANDPDVSSKKVDDTDTTCMDETYCEINDSAKNCLNSQDSVFFEDQITQEKLMQSPKSDYKSSLADLNGIPEKRVSNVYNGPVRKKTERAKLRGFSCRDCEKYYEDMDLSENELQKRKDLCSRHRAHQKIRESTPEGFWDPYFPDTCTASFGYD